jgi:hypothetical protein
MRASSKLVVISLSLLLLSGAAFANKCEDFATYTCAKSAPDQVRFTGLASGQSVGILLNSNMFTIHDANGSGGADVVILAASPNGAPSGTLDGIGFSTLSSFPEQGAVGAIQGSLSNLGLCSGACTLSYGYVDLKTALPAGGSLTVTLSGVANGTVLYAVVLNSKGQIIYITPNSEAGIVDVGTSAVPEPGSLSLLVTGLLGIGGQAWRKLRG